MLLHISATLCIKVMAHYTLAELLLFSVGAILMNFILYKYIYIYIYRLGRWR